MKTLKKLTILFAPIDAVGPVNSCIGIAEPLQARGHRIVFAVAHGWKGKLSPLGFEEEFTGKVPSGGPSNPSATWTRIMSTWKPWMSLDPFEQYSTIFKSSYSTCFEVTRDADAFLARIIDRVRPDVIVTETVAPSVAILKSGVPYVYMNTNQVLWCLGTDIPPPFSGLSPRDPRDPGTRAEWRRYEDEFWRAVEPTWQRINEWLVANGLKCRPIRGNCFPVSPFANICMIPKELDYGEKAITGWYKFDNFMRSESNFETFALTIKFMARPGKLVYFSMGSIGSANVEMMQRLIDILAKSPNKFVVSKGPLHEQITLADNMFGQPSLPQTKVLQMVDLVMTHGGNNTTTETMAAGKPMIVMPLFTDQFDNAVQVSEKGFGVSLNPFEVSESQLLAAVDNVLNDDVMRHKCRKAGERIRSANNTESVADLVEKVAEKYAK